MTLKYVFQRLEMQKVVETQEYYLCMGLCVEISVYATKEN